jgi:hypothetical protein
MMMVEGENRIAFLKPIPAQICQSLISQGLDRDRTVVSVVKDWRVNLEAWQKG